MSLYYKHSLYIMTKPMTKPKPDNTKSWNILVGDCRDQLKELPDQSVHTIWTSPPYFGLRDYDQADQIGLEPSPEEFVEAMTLVMDECMRVLRDDGTLWLNIGDSYSSKKDKQLLGIPWKVAFALQERGWILRNDIIWAKGISGQKDFTLSMKDAMLRKGIDPQVVRSILSEMTLTSGNAMPESVTDRSTYSHEYMFLFSKKKKYYYDHHAIKDPQVLLDGTRNRRSVWCVPTKPFGGAHHATAPLDLVTPCIQASTSEKGCCSQCGAPYIRDVEVLGSDSEPLDQRDTGRIRQPGNSPIKTSSFGNGREIIEKGWKPGCPCKGSSSSSLSSSSSGSPSSSGSSSSLSSSSSGSPSIVPCTVLDPFAGAATTLLAADHLGRNSIGIELNPDYALIAEDRLMTYRSTLPPLSDRYIPLESDNELEDEFDSVTDLFNKEEGGG